MGGSGGRRGVHKTEGVEGKTDRTRRRRVVVVIQ